MASLDGQAVFSANSASFEEFIHALYQHLKTDYPKFYKMDNQSKLGLMAAELLLNTQHFLQRNRGEEIGMVLSNAVGSADTDKRYYETVAKPEDYFPSPSLFVYTLPSMVTGEICIKYKIKGETAFFVSDNFRAELLYPYIQNLMKYTETKACIGGWVNYDASGYDAFLFTIESTSGKYPEPVNAKMLNQIYQ
ncbi:MAG: 3-oxoacyl-ACP synthase [Bacteroidota bacterium]